MFRVHEHIAIDEPRKAAANERANPVDPVVLKVAAGNGRPEGTGRVHGSTGEWAGGQDVGTDNETDGNGCNGAQ